MQLMETHSPLGHTVPNHHSGEQISINKTTVHKTAQNAVLQNGSDINIYNYFNYNKYRMYATLWGSSINV